MQCNDRQFDTWNRIKNLERETYIIVNLIYERVGILTPIEIGDYVINELIML